LTLTGLNIDRDQLLLVTAADRGRIMYNFADSSVTASAFTSGANTALTLVATTAGLTTTASLVIYYDDQLASTTVTVSSLPAISGTVTANVGNFQNDILGGYVSIVEIFQNEPVLVARDNSNDLTSLKTDASKNLLISGTVTIGSALPAGTNRIGVVTIGAGTVTIGAGTAQIGSVTANIPLVNIQPTVTTGLGVILLTDEGKSVFDNSSSIKSTLTTALPTGTNRIGVVTIGGGTVTIGAGTSQIGSVTASISNSVVTFYPLQGTSVSATNFTSTTASTTLVSAVDGREVLTVFNEGAGNLHISPGATCTTVAYQVRLSAGDYWECPAGQLSLAHTAVFATAGTARICQVS